jgi:hypothetical protein
MALSLDVGLKTIALNELLRVWGFYESKHEMGDYVARIHSTSQPCIKTNKTFGQN